MLVPFLFTIKISSFKIAHCSNKEEVFEKFPFIQLNLYSTLRKKLKRVCNALCPVWCEVTVIYLYNCLLYILYVYSVRVNLRLRSLAYKLYLYQRSLKVIIAGWNLNIKKKSHTKCLLFSCLPTGNINNKIGLNII